MLCALEMLKGARRVLLCMLETVEGELYLLEVLNVMYCGGWALFAGKMLEVPEAIC